MVRSIILATKTTRAIRQPPAPTIMLAMMYLKTFKSPTTTTHTCTPVGPALPESTITMEEHAKIVLMERLATEHILIVMLARRAGTQRQTMTVVIFALQIHTVALDKNGHVIIALEERTLTARQSLTMIATRDAKIALQERNLVRVGLALGVKQAKLAMLDHLLAQIARQANTLSPRLLVATAKTESIVVQGGALVRIALLGPK